MPATELRLAFAHCWAGIWCCGEINGEECQNGWFGGVLVLRDGPQCNRRWEWCPLTSSTGRNSREGCVVPHSSVFNLSWESRLKLVFVLFLTNLFISARFFFPCSYQGVLNLDARKWRGRRRSLLPGDRDRTQGSGPVLCWGFRLGLRKNSFSIRVAKHRDRCPNEVPDAPCCPWGLWGNSLVNTLNFWLARRGQAGGPDDLCGPFPAEPFSSKWRPDAEGKALIESVGWFWEGACLYESYCISRWQQTIPK